MDLELIEFEVIEVTDENSIRWQNANKNCMC